MVLSNNGYCFHYRYLKERLKQMEEEKAIAQATAAKYKVK